VNYKRVGFHINMSCVIIFTDIFEDLWTIYATCWY